MDNGNVAMAVLVYIVAVVLLVVFYGALCQWVWNDFVVTHVHAAARASLAASMIPGSVLTSVTVSFGRSSSS